MYIYSEGVQAKTSLPIGLLQKYGKKIFFETGTNVGHGVELLERHAVLAVVHVGRGRGEAGFGQSIADASDKRVHAARVLRDDDAGERAIAFGDGNPGLHVRPINIQCHEFAHFKLLQDGFRLMRVIDFCRASACAQGAVPT